MNMSNYYLHYLKERKKEETKIAFLFSFWKRLPIEGNLFSEERNS
jgi:hypothetical protein